MSNTPPSTLSSQHILLLDEITVSIGYANALAAVAIGSDFTQFETPIVHNYWGAMCSLLEKIAHLQEQWVCVFYQMLNQAPQENSIEEIKE